MNKGRSYTPYLLFVSSILTGAYSGNLRPRLERMGPPDSIRMKKVGEELYRF